MVWNCTSNQLRKPIMFQAVQFDLPIGQNVQVLPPDQAQVKSKTSLVTKQMQKDTQIDESQSRIPDFPKQSVPCFCFDIGHFSEIVQFTLLTTLVMVFFLVYGYMQEWIFGIRDMKNHGWFVTLVQFAFYSVMSSFEMSWSKSSRTIPLKIYGFLALCQLTTMGFSNASLGYLNYPTQVVFKCCKLIPVLIGGIAIQGKRYGPLDFSAALLMSIGLILFTLADSRVSTKFDIVGVIMISIALVADAILGNMQEKTMKEFHAPNAEVIFYSYFFGALYLGICLLFSGHLLPGLEYFAENKMERYGSSLIFSISGYLGMQIILTFVRRFGAFITVTVTSFRKVISIVISFLAFSKPFTMDYVYSGSLVLLGIYLNLLGKRYRHLNLHTIFVMTMSEGINPWSRSRKKQQHLMSV